MSLAYWFSFASSSQLSKLLLIYSPVISQISFRESILHFWLYQTLTSAHSVAEPSPKLWNPGAPFSVWTLCVSVVCLSLSSIEYWFRCMDLDGDGVLSMYELEHFYEEQCQKLETMAIEPLPFEDCLCQMLDLVKPEVEGWAFICRHTLI